MVRQREWVGASDPSELIYKGMATAKKNFLEDMRSEKTWEELNVPTSIISNLTGEHL